MWKTTAKGFAFIDALIALTLVAWLSVLTLTQVARLTRYETQEWARVGETAESLLPPRLSS